MKHRLVISGRRGGGAHTLGLALLLSIAACGGDDGVDPPIDPPECTTGCSDGIECLPGTSEQACGSAGQMCQVCGTDQICSDGECADVVDEGCDASTCDGCCDGDVCLSGTSGSACGSAGVECADCGPRGVCETGGENTCEVDEASRWNVIAVRATLPEVNEGGGTWDSGGGLPDAYGIGTLDDEEVGRTDVVNDTLEPIWEMVVGDGVRADEVGDVVFEIFDSDLNADDSIGRCSLPTFPFEAFAESNERTVTCPEGAGYEVILVLEPN